MKIDDTAQLREACFLALLLKAGERGLTSKELAEEYSAMTVEQKLDALARYQEHRPNA